MPTWLRVDQGLFDHPKTLALEQHLGVEDAWRYPVLLWSWCLDNRDSGHLGEITPKVLARACRWAGDAEAFMRAMLVVGFIAENGHGYVVHDWLEHQGKVFQERDKKRRLRKAAYLEEHPSDRDTSPSCPGTVPGQSRDLSRDSLQPTEDGRRKTEEVQDRPPVVPPGGGTPAHGEGDELHLEPVVEAPEPPSTKRQRSEPIPYGVIEGLMNAESARGFLPTIAPTDKNRRVIRAAHLTVMHQDVERWRDFVKRCGDDDWLCGRDPKSNGWRMPSWAWAIKKADEILSRDPRKRSPGKGRFLPAAPGQDYREFD